MATLPKNSELGELRIVEDGMPFGIGLGDLEGLRKRRRRTPDAPQHGGSADGQSRGGATQQEFTTFHIKSPLKQNSRQAARQRNQIGLTKVGK